jgi:hypothetical protein
MPSATTNPPIHVSPSTHKLVHRLQAVGIWFCTFLIRFYQAFVRPHLIGGCKYHPTCSEYALAVLHSQGLLRGLWLTIKRVARCHPFARGGYDPPP